MEEIAGTLTLEREIMEDARRKAARLLASADAESTRIRSDSAARTAAALIEIDKAATLATERYRDEVFARIPLEKLRLKTAHSDSLIRKALATWLGSLPEARLEGFAKKRLQDARDFLGGDALELRYRGMSADSVGRLAALLGEKSSVPVREDAGLPHPGVFVSSEKAELDATLGVAMEMIMREKRGELVRAIAPDLVGT